MHLIDASQTMLMMLMCMYFVNQMKTLISLRHLRSESWTGVWNSWRQFRHTGRSATWQPAKSVFAAT